jgi:hypothetical protein
MERLPVEQKPQKMRMMMRKRSSQWQRRYLQKLEAPKEKWQPHRSLIQPLQQQTSQQQITQPRQPRHKQLLQQQPEQAILCSTRKQCTFPWLPCSLSGI